MCIFLFAVNRAPPPAPAAQASGGGGMLSGIGSTIAQGIYEPYVCLSFVYKVHAFLCLNASLLLNLGMAFGTGSAVAHRAVDAVMGPRTIQHEGVETASASAAPAAAAFSSSCDLHAKAFQDVSCLHSHSHPHYNTFFFCFVCLSFLQVH